MGDQGLTAPPPPPPPPGSPADPHAPAAGRSPAQDALGLALDDSVVQSLLLEDPESWSGDHIATLARAIAEAPAGFVVLLVDQEGSRDGLVHSLVGAEEHFDRAALTAFCGTAVLSRRPLLVPDLQADPRFRDEPLLKDHPEIRSYAGFPVIGPDGLVLGCLGVVHWQPHALDPERVRALERLALLVVKRLQLQRLERMVQRSQGDAAVAGSQEASPASPTSRLLSRDQLLDTLAAAQQLGTHLRCALLRCEIREYNRISASFGGRVAAGVISAATERLVEALPEEALAARFCDAEFLLLLPHGSQGAVIESVAQRLVQHFGSQPFRVEHHTFPLTLAIGIATAGPENPSPDALSTEACIARRLAARAIGSQYRFLDARTRLRVVEDFAFEEQLRAALESGRFEPFFQPITLLEHTQADAGGVEFVGFEVLVRWLNDDGEFVQPSQFLGVSARLGLAGEIDLQVIRKALRAAPALARSCAERSMLLSVNLSAQLLGDVLLRERLLDLIRAEPLPAGWTLQVEIVEEALQDTTPAFDAFLGDLVALSVSIAIDDFGIGYSSLGRLHSLPIQAIKIDRSFVKQIDDPVSPSNRLLRTMLDLGRDLGLSLTAEGVETRHQCDWLRRLGVQQGQGYLFARPMAFEDTLRYLREQSAAAEAAAAAAEAAAAVAAAEAAAAARAAAAASAALSAAQAGQSAGPSGEPGERLVRTVPESRGLLGRLFRGR